MNAAKYREIIEENLLLGTEGLNPAFMFTFRQQKDSKNTARITIEGFRTNLPNC